MNLRYAGACRRCGTMLAAGDDAVYERTTKAVRCVTCTDTSNAIAGTAGASARREHDRRRESRERRIRAEHPKLGGLILALSGDPQSTKSWEQGAIGEELMSQRLADLPDSFQILHDRRIPGTRANIDHIAVGPSGVWVIDAKRYKGKRPTMHVEGGLVRPRVESLRIGGRDGTKLVNGVRSQIDRVSGALSGLDVPITGVLCFLEADWPLVGGSFTVNEVHVTWPRLLIKQMTATPDAQIDVARIYTQLASAFPIA